MTRACAKCGHQTEDLIVSVQDGSEGCWPCIAGPDQTMLRRVELQTTGGFEVHMVHAKNNREAFQMVDRPDVLQMIASPLPN